MKLYKFYYKASKNDIVHDIDNKHKKSRDDYIQDKYPLYAFTADKKLYKEFKKERNMDSFIILKSDIDREDYAEYAQEHRACLIDRAEFSVKDDDGKIQNILFAITDYEQLILDDIDVEYLMGDKSYFVSDKIFNKDIRKALKVLEYPFFYATITGNEEELEKYDQVNVRNNDFEILYSQFSGTF